MRNTTPLFGLLLATVGLQSCAINDFPRRRVIVVDELGSPILGAGTYPQPFVPGPKQSGIDGSLWVYGGAPGVTFRINAPGYKPVSFPFDQASDQCVLEREKEYRVTDK